ETQSVASAGHPLWVAHWTTSATPLVPAANWAGQSWTFWQWTDCVKVPGFAHCSDGDRYRGPDPAAVAIPAYPNGAPSGSSPPTIVGTAQTGKTLAGIPGTWAGGKPVTFAYQWQRCDAAGGTCAPIVGATAETYLPVADDVGHALVLAVTAQALGGSATASLGVTATGKGGSTAAAPVVTGVVAAAPVPAATPGSAAAQAGVAGAVSSLDGTATVTWQPGTVPTGSTVSLAASGKGLVLGVSPAVAQLPWPVDLAYAAAPAGNVVGYSADAR